MGAPVTPAPPVDDVRDGPALRPRAHPSRDPHSLCAYSANRVRRSFLENLPTLVLGTSSMNSTASGIHHLATSGLRCSRISSWVAVSPSRTTTQASGRSSHFGCGMPMTAASFTAGWLMIAFSRSTELIHSPPDLIRSLVRSAIRIEPKASIAATSPVRIQPSGAARSPPASRVVGGAGEPDRAEGVHRGDVTGAHPAVGRGELHAGVGVVVVLRAPRAAHL